MPEQQQVGRGIMQRQDRLMTNEEVLAYLKKSQVAHVATVDEDGWPYVIPFVYVFEGGTKLYLHTGNIRASLFHNNIQHNPRVCLEVSEMNELQPGRHACSSALVFTSVVAYGNLKVIEGDEIKTWFYDRLLVKYGNPEWKFEPGYPAAGKTIILELDLEIVTGKRSEGFRH